MNGLRRNNFSPETCKKIKKAYHHIYLSDLNRSQAVSQIQIEFKSIAEIDNIIDFIEKSDRGLI